MVTSFPIDITEEILLKLPIKSLLRFRIVSKELHSLISKDYFIAKHMNESSSSSSNLALFEIKGGIVKFTDNTFGSLHRLPFPDGYSGVDEYYCSIVGSANGLICLVSYSKKFGYIWNPCTGNYKKITIPLAKNREYDLIGFGHDAVSDDYKIFGEWDSKFRVFSSKTNSWKILEKDYLYNNLGRSYNNIDSVFSNGTIHWFCDNMKTIIVAFDLAKEEPFHIMMPEGFDYYAPLSNYQGSLCLIDDKYSPEATTSNIWVMKEYGNAESWVKLFTVKAPQFGQSLSF